MRPAINSWKTGVTPPCVHCQGKRSAKPIKKTRSTRASYRVWQSAIIKRPRAANACHSHCNLIQRRRWRRRWYRGLPVRPGAVVEYRDIRSSSLENHRHSLPCCRWYPIRRSWRPSRWLCDHHRPYFLDWTTRVPWRSPRCTAPRCATPRYAIRSAPLRLGGAPDPDDATCGNDRGGQRWIADHQPVARRGGGFRY